jgi:UDP-glucose 4-epimerase
LLSEGNYVTAYDNLSSGRKEWISQHLASSHFDFVQGDLLDYEVLVRSMGGHHFVWHMGANADIPSGYRDTELHLRHCIVATRNVLEAMRKNGVRQVVFASSSAVYGEAQVSPTPETYGPLRPISLYGAAKLANEGQISAYCHLYGIQAWMFRFANVVGGRMSHGVIHDFIRKLERNPAELEVWGSGEQEKPFFLVEDCIDGMAWCVARTEGDADIFNLACTSTTSVRQVAKIVIEEFGLSDPRIRYTGGRQGFPGDVPVLRLDVEKVARLGWQTQSTSDEAVRIAARRLLGKEPIDSFARSAR